MDDETAEELRQVALSLDPRQIQQLLRLHKETILAPLLDLATRELQFLVDAAADPVLEEPVLDYVTDLTVRKMLLSRLEKIIFESKLKCRINMALFAIFMVAPIEQLRSTLGKLEENIRENNQGQINQFVSQCEITCVASVQAIANKGGRPSGSSANSVRSAQATPVQESPTKRQRQTHERSVSDSKVSQLPTTPSQQTPNQPTTPNRPTTPGRRTPSRRTPSRPTTPNQPTTIGPSFNPHYQSPTDNTQILALNPALAAPQTPTLEAAGTPNSSRNREAAHLCKKRDGMRCKFTGMEDPHAAHIFPFSVSKGSKIPNIVSTLRTFWGDETTTRLSEMFLNQNVTESPQNLISLNSQLHFWFDNGKMALKPLRKLDDGTVQVQLHWLKKSTLKPTDVFQYMDVNNAIGSAGISQNQTWGMVKAHRSSGLPLRTGQVYNLGAQDPDHIPNFDLLQLSWDLLRVVAICGAAEPSDLSDFDDDDDNDYGYEVDAESAMYYDDNYAEMSRWAREVENGEEEDREEDPSYNGKSSF